MGSVFNQDFKTFLRRKILENKSYDIQSRYFVLIKKKSKHFVKGFVLFKNIIILKDCLVNWIFMGCLRFYQQIFNMKRSLMKTSNKRVCFEICF